MAERAGLGPLRSRISVASSRDMASIRAVVAAHKRASDRKRANERLDSVHFMLDRAVVDNGASLLVGNGHGKDRELSVLKISSQAAPINIGQAEASGQLSTSLELATFLSSSLRLSS